LQNDDSLIFSRSELDGTGFSALYTPSTFFHFPFLRNYPMSAYAVIETGGKQYKVSEGDILQVEKLDAEAGSTVTFDSVLAVSGGDGLSLDAKAPIQAEVLEHIRGPKLLAFKKKRRKGYKRRVGHRQGYTKVKITGLS